MPSRTLSRMWVTTVTLAVLCVALPCYAQTAASSNSALSPTDAKAATQTAATPEQAKLLKSTEAFVRVLFGWGPEIKVQLGPLGPSATADFYTVPVQLTLNDHTESGVLYVSKDGKTLLRGEIFDTSTDPFAANRAKLHTEDSPSKGPADAKVTLVEFSDFECPHCRDLWEAMKGIEAKYPQIRIVHKDFPLTDLHPWAETAAIAGRCAFDQSPDAFWKVEDSIFGNQDLISAENAWEKLVDFAAQAGLNPDTFKICLSSPDAQKAVDASRAEGLSLGVDSTPTVYINGRSLTGGDPGTLSQYIDFELQAKK